MPPSQESEGSLDAEAAKQLEVPIAPPLELDSREESPRTQDGRLEHEVRNWIFCISLLVFCTTTSAIVLVVHGTPAYGPRPESTTLLLIFHCVLAVIATIGPFSAMLAGGQEVNYKVIGQPQIPPVKVTIHRITWFTVWSNWMNSAHFWLAVAHDAIGSSSAPMWLTVAEKFSWEITFPMSFLVNIVVTLALIPELRRSGTPEQLFLMMNWRGELHHNGFVIMTALEAAFVAPSINVADFTIVILYGSLYSAFACLFFLKVGIFHYSFMDPRFKLAPLAVLALLLLLTTLLIFSHFAVRLAEVHWLGGAAILVAAAATCTWRWPRGLKSHDQEFEGITTFGLIARFLGIKGQRRLEGPLVVQS